MSTFLITDAEPSNPPADIRYLEKDSAIVRGVTRALIDFSNPETYDGSGNIPLNTQFRNLVAGGSPAAIGSSGVYGAPVYLGTLQSDNGAGGGSVGYPLPLDFVFPASATHTLVGAWFRAPKSGYPASGTISLPVLGVGAGGNASSQYALLVSGPNTGTANSLIARFRGSALNIDATINAGSVLDAILDGNLHQLMMSFSVVDGIGTVRLYVDKVLRATGSGAAVGHNVVANMTAALFTAPAYGSWNQPNTKVLNARIGRPQAHNLTGRNDVTVEALIAADWDGSQGYLA